MSIEKVIEKYRSSTIFSPEILVVSVFVVIILAGCNKSEPDEIRINLSPNGDQLITDKIQQAIDSCASAGGGIVYFPEGKYLTGGLHIKSNVTLEIAKGAILQGSNDYRDYGEGKWNNALIAGDNVKNITIKGEGLIDGVDCKNPQGEEGFRGPHCIRLTNCDSIVIRDITIKRSGNWAINCRHCSDAKVKNVNIRGGHDGLHTRFCSNFYVEGCDFRTGDDCFAGNDNRDFNIKDCKINTSCNGFRLGCLNLKVKNCKIWGPGEYKHISQNRTNMLSAFVHFSPEGEDPKLVSGNWHIENLTIDSVGTVYNYNYENGLWQTGKPVTDVTFEKITATRIQKPTYIRGDTNRSLNLTINNSSFSYSENAEISDSLVFEGRKANTPAFFNIIHFDKVTLHDVTINTNNQDPVIMANKGNQITMDSVRYKPRDNPKPFILENIGQINN